MEKTEDVKRVVEEVEAAGATDVDTEYVAEKLAKLKTFRVTGIEAIRSVVSGILSSQGIKRAKGVARTNPLLSVEQIDAPDVWCNIRVKVTQLWDSDKDSIRQIGLLGDETGVMKFVSWEKANLALLEVDKCYSIENVVTNEYDERFSVAFTKNTRIMPIDEDLEIGFATVEYSGILVSVQKGSGLIKRCVLCNRAMQHGECKEHGRIEGVHDLRIKAVLDNGITTKNVLLSRERTEELTGINMEDAVAMATEALDAEVVAEQMSRAIMMREYEVSGQDMNGTILSTRIVETNNPILKEDVESLLKEARFNEPRVDDFRKKMLEV